MIDIMLARMVDDGGSSAPAQIAGERPPWEEDRHALRATLKFAPLVALRKEQTIGTRPR